MGMTRGNGWWVVKPKPFITYITYASCTVYQHPKDREHYERMKAFEESRGYPVGPLLVNLQKTYYRRSI